MIVYELCHYGRGYGSRVALCASVDIAKRIGLEKIEEYREYADEPDTEGIIADPKWRIAQPIWGNRAGRPSPMIIYGDCGSGFIVYEVEVLDE
jgi:hypothetical protein